MDDLHIRLPEGLKRQLKKHCRDANISVTSAIIIMITNELREQKLSPLDSSIGDDDQFVGFLLRQ
ncbi:hypothetical protein JJJ17_11900 [Paracoccus caeni]|uniref:Uncharacterized protein n=1 Tax=Paracoccus caeni TaxID=657651 RepID=A0A934VZ33_9RHOB|nr:hypothetical protein [Paracoccus caeni]MBK4216632.1 hypothetical protein [Paracoccus caeni]